MHLKNYLVNMQECKIFRFQAFNVEKDKFGDHLNAHCALVPDDNDWIQIMDWDAMFLCPESYQVVDKAIENNPGIKIFGCMTNRVGRSIQCLNIEPDKNDSIKYHIQLAKICAKKFPNGEVVDAPMTAGFFMLFQKSYWKRNPFQREVMNRFGMLFDHAFCKEAKNEGKIRIIKGVYLWHTYRLTHADWHDKSHLGVINC
jgi:hypothetical protein